MALNWNEVFGLQRPKQQQGKLQQINELSSEALADEVKKDPNGEAKSSGTSPLPSQQATEQQPGSDETDETSQPPSSASQDDEAGAAPEDQGAEDEDSSTDSSSEGSESDTIGDSGEGDDSTPSDGGDDSSDPSTDGNEDDSDTSKDPGKDPLRDINGKILMAKDIRDFISEVESVLESLEQIALESPAVVKLGDLKEAAELLLESVTGVPVEGTMVRYEMLVREFEDLVKELKKA